jgi:acid phosphatase (class A)
MNKRLLRFAFMVLWSGFSCLGFTVDLSAQATANATTASTSATPVYLTGQEKAWGDFPKSPTLGSAVDQSDLVITLSAQASRTDVQAKEAVRDQTFSVKLVTDVIDPAFETKYPNLFLVLTNADGDGNFINSILKKANARLRPFVQHPILVMPLFSDSNFSYPSGHATRSELQARILGVLFPAQADALLNRARQIADSRVVAGVHYASDTEAGLTLGDRLFAELEATDKFKQDLSKAAAQDRMAPK